MQGCKDQNRLVQGQAVRSSPRTRPDQTGAEQKTIRRSWTEPNPDQKKIENRTGPDQDGYHMLI